jgi:amino acid transporter
MKFDLKSPWMLIAIGAAVGYFAYATLIGSVPALGGYYKFAQNNGAQ